MPELEHVTKQTGDFKALVRAAKTGDVIRIGRSPTEYPDFRVCRQGVLCKIPEKGFFLINDGEPQLVHTYRGKCKDWFPYGENEILVILDEEILWLHDETKSERVYRQGPWIQCEPHIYTESVIGYDQKSHKLLWIGKYQSEEKVAKGLVFWRSHFYTRHVREIYDGPNCPHDLGHPEGLIRFEKGTFTLHSPSGSKVVCTTNQSNPRGWIACGQGIVFPANHNGSEPLSFNDDPHRTFYCGHYDKVISTPYSCVILHNHILYHPENPNVPFCNVAYDCSDNVMPHPYGVLTLYQSLFSLIVVKAPAL
jgi:hypothetical protein